MTRVPGNGGRTIVPCLHIPMSEAFEICWAGPSPLGAGMCFGSTDGRIVFADEKGHPLPGLLPGKGSVQGEAINGVVRAGTWAVVSSRADVNFWPLPGTAGGDEEGWAALYGAHGVLTTGSGHLLAPLGRNGIMVVDPPFSHGTSVTALGDNQERLYVYRVISLRSPSGTEVLACAARLDGIAVGEFLGPRMKHALKTATFGDLDVIDIRALDPGTNSLAVAALGQDGIIILFRDVLKENKPLIMKFKRVQGTAYRLLSQGGELYVLTSRGVYALGKLVSRFLGQELRKGVETQILSMAMEAVDVNLVASRWLLVVMPDEIRRFDTHWIHENVPESEAEDFEATSISREWQWRDVKQTSKKLVLA